MFAFPTITNIIQYNIISYTNCACIKLLIINDIQVSTNKQKKLSLHTTPHYVALRCWYLCVFLFSHAIFRIANKLSTPNNIVTLHSEHCIMAWSMAANCSMRKAEELSAGQNCCVCVRYVSAHAGVSMCWCQRRPQWQDC